jgi:hypothetical protein
MTISAAGTENAVQNGRRKRNFFKNLDEILLNPINSKSLIPETIEEKAEYLFDLTVMIWADGIVTDNEYSTLQKYVSMFGFVEENVKDIADYFIEAVKQQKVSRIF